MSFQDDALVVPPLPRAGNALDQLTIAGMVALAHGDDDMAAIVDVAIDGLYARWELFWGQVAQAALLEALYDYARPLGYNFATKPALARWLEGLRL